MVGPLFNNGATNLNDFIAQAESDQSKLGVAITAHIPGQFSSSARSQFSPAQLAPPGSDKGAVPHRQIGIRAFRAIDRTMKAMVQFAAVEERMLTRSSEQLLRSAPVTSPRLALPPETVAPPRDTMLLLRGFLGNCLRSLHPSQYALAQHATEKVRRVIPLYQEMAICAHQLHLEFNRALGKPSGELSPQSVKRVLDTAGRIREIHKLYELSLEQTGLRWLRQTTPEPPKS